MKKPHTHLKILILTLAAIGSPGLIHAEGTQAGPAQQSSENRADSTELEAIEVAARRRYASGYQPISADVIGGGNTPLLEIPRSVNIVTPAVLEDRRPGSLDEALLTVSGIRQANTLAGTLEAVVKRGFGDNRDNSVLRNGMQMTQTHVFSPTAERVEVLKGPASTLYGVQDPGGVVNVVTKQPQLKANRTVSASLGSHSSRQIGVDFTGPIGDSQHLAYRFIADHRQSDYWRNFGEIKQTTLAPSIKWIGENTTLTAAYEYLDYTVPFDRGTFIDSTAGANYGKPLSIPAERRLDEPFSEQSGKNHLFQFTLDHYLNENWKARLNYGFTYHTYDDWKARITNTAAGINTANGTVRRRIDGTQDARLRVHNLALGLSGDVRQGNVRHKLSFGMEAMHNDRLLGKIYQSTSQYNLNMYNPEYGRISPQPGVNTFDGQGNNTQQTEILKTFALYANDDIHLGDKWIVSAGLRADYFDQYAGRANRNFVFTANTDNHGWNLSPSLGLTYRLTPQWSLYGSYATSFRPQVSIANGIPGDAKPEKGRAFEIGAKFAGERLSAAVAAFHIVKENVRYTVTAGGQSEARFAGRARSMGLEAELGGQITERLGVNANYAYTETKVLEAEAAAQGLPLNNTPRNQFGLYLTYDFGNALGGNWRAGLGAKYNGAWYIGKNTAGGDRLWKVPSATVADAFVSYDTKIGGNKLNVRLNGKNLTNRLYYTSTVGSSAQYPMIAIGDPREISVSAKFEF